MPRLGEHLVDFRTLQMTFTRWSNVPRVSRETAATMLGGLLLLLGVYSYLWSLLYNNYLPFKDDPAVIAGTLKGGVSGWLTRGLTGYFHVYPEWPQPAFSNFYRPVANLIIYVEQALFGRSYWAWFLAFCTIQYAACLLFLHVQRLIGVPSRPALLLTILFLFNSAFFNEGLIFPGFQFDVFASLMLLLAFYQLLESRYALALLLITAAVFTKESAIFAPVAAAMTVAILKRDAKWSVVMLLPLILWVSARWLAFHAVVGGTFESPATIRVLLSNIGTALLVWPSGAMSLAAIAQFPTDLSGARGAGLFAVMFLNTALWAFLGYASWKLARELRVTPWSTAQQFQLVLLIWALGALSFCVVTLPQTRLGASFYTFLLLFLGCFLFAGSRSKTLSLAPILVVSFATCLKDGNFILHAVDDELAARDSAAALYSGLRSLPQDGRAVFVVNAPNMFSAPSLLAKSWDLKLNITFISQFSGCQRAHSEQGGYELSATSLLVKIPSCALYAFVGVPSDIQSTVSTTGLRRPGIGMYQFPDHGKATHLRSGGIDYGDALQLRFEHAPGTVLAYDWQDGAYRRLDTASQ